MIFTIYFFHCLLLLLFLLILLKLFQFFDFCLNFPLSNYFYSLNFPNITLQKQNFTNKNFLYRNIFSNFELLKLKLKVMILQPEQKLKQIRELKNLSQEYIANQLGLSVRAYSKI